MGPKLTEVLVAVGETHSKLYDDDQKEKGRMSNSPRVAFPELRRGFRRGSRERMINESSTLSFS